MYRRTQILWQSTVEVNEFLNLWWIFKTHNRLSPEYARMIADETVKVILSKCNQMIKAIQFTIVNALVILWHILLHIQLSYTKTAIHFLLISRLTDKKKTKRKRKKPSVTENIQTFFSVFRWLIKRWDGLWLLFSWNGNATNVHDKQNGTKCFLSITLKINEFYRRSSTAVKELFVIILFLSAKYDLIFIKCECEESITETYKISILFPL